MFRQNALLRRDALGNFGDLLHAVAKDPAMLQYLDGAGSRKGQPNENFAREVMELFTLGEGHYSQQDVTGGRAGLYRLDARSEYARLSYSSQTFTTTATRPSSARAGDFDGDQVLDILLAQPETATFITTELWREFISETPDPAQIAPIAERFRASHYDIKTALRGLFLSEAFWDERNRGVLVKSPAEFVVGAVREFDIGYADQDATALAGQMRNFGENLFYPPNVKGWPGGENWINSSTLLARKQFIEQLFRATEAHGMRPAATNAKTSAMAGPMSAARNAQHGDQRRHETCSDARVRIRACVSISTHGSRDTTRRLTRARTCRRNCNCSARCWRSLRPTPSNLMSPAALICGRLLMDPAYQLK